MGLIFLLLHAIISFVVGKAVVLGSPYQGDFSAELNEVPA